MSQAKEYFHLIEKLENDPEFCFMVTRAGESLLRIDGLNTSFHSEQKRHYERVEELIQMLDDNSKSELAELLRKTKTIRKDFTIHDENHPTYKQCVQTISKDAKWSLINAYFLKTHDSRVSDHFRFPLGENVISQNALYSFIYAKEVIGRFELGEDAISKNPEMSIDYTKEVLGRKRFEIAEQGISKCPHNSAKYAAIIGRFELGEPAIATVPNLSYWYAEQIIKGRFELGEDAMMQDESIMLKYAQNIMKGKLPEKMHNAMVLLTYGNKEAA